MQPQTARNAAEKLVYNVATDILVSMEIDYAYGARTGDIESRGYYHLTWTFHEERRLGDHCQQNVLTIDAVEIGKRWRGKGIITTFIGSVLEGDSRPQIPMQFLHFKDCTPRMSHLLERLHFHKYEIGSSTDWWHPVIGQKQLPL